MKLVKLLFSCLLGFFICTMQGMNDENHNEVATYMKKWQELKRELHILELEIQRVDAARTAMWYHITTTIKLNSVVDQSVLDTIRHSNSLKFYKNQLKKRKADLEKIAQFLSLTDSITAHDHEAVNSVNYEDFEADFNKYFFDFGDPTLDLIHLPKVL